MSGSLHLAQLVERAALVAAKSHSIVEADGTELWADTAVAVAARARSLQAAGVVPGARVAILADNSGDFIRTFLAIARAGAIAAPLNTRLTGAELAAAAAQVRPDLPVLLRTAIPEAAQPHRDKFAAIIDKPMIGSRLVGAVKTALQAASA